MCQYKHGSIPPPSVLECVCVFFLSLQKVPPHQPDVEHKQWTVTFQILFKQDANYRVKRTTEIDIKEVSKERVVSKKNRNTAKAGKWLVFKYAKAVVLGAANRFPVKIYLLLQLQHLSCGLCWIRVFSFSPPDVILLVYNIKDLFFL